MPNYLGQFTVLVEGIYILRLLRVIELMLIMPSLQNLGTIILWIRLHFLYFFIMNYFNFITDLSDAKTIILASSLRWEQQWEHITPGLGGQKD